jgi:hypothetical protein
MLSAVTAALPTLDIAEGALDKIFSIYKDILPGLGGYLTHAGELHPGRLEALLQRLAAMELETLEQRAAVRLALRPLIQPVLDVWVELLEGSLGPRMSRSPHLVTH